MDELAGIDAGALASMARTVGQIHGLIESSGVIRSAGKAYEHQMLEDGYGKREAAAGGGVFHDELLRMAMRNAGTS